MKYTIKMIGGGGLFTRCYKQLNSKNGERGGRYIELSPCDDSD